MLQNDLERREIADQRREDAFDEHGFAIEDVDIAIGYFAVDQQRHPDPLHRFQQPGELADIGDAVGGVGGGMGGIELAGSEHALFVAALDFRRIGIVRQVADHQRVKSVPAGRAAIIRSRYACAEATLMTGGVRFGMTMARANWRAV